MLYNIGKTNNSHPASIAKLIGLRRAQNAKVSLFPALGNEFDWVRNLRITAIGTFIAQPAIYAWYMTGMQKISNSKWLKSKNKLQKTLYLTFFDQSA